MRARDRPVLRAGAAQTKHRVPVPAHDVIQHHGRDPGGNPNSPVCQLLAEHASIGKVISRHDEGRMTNDDGAPAPSFVLGPCSFVAMALLFRQPLRMASGRTKTAAGHVYYGMERKNQQEETIRVVVQLNDGPAPTEAT